MKSEIAYSVSRPHAHEILTSFDNSVFFQLHNTMPIHKLQRLTTPTTQLIPIKLITNLLSSQLVCKNCLASLKILISSCHGATENPLINMQAHRSGIYSWTFLINYPADSEFIKFFQGVSSGMGWKGACSRLVLIWRFLRLINFLCNIFGWVTVLLVIWSRIKL